MKYEEPYKELNNVQHIWTGSSQNCVCAHLYEDNFDEYFEDNNKL